MKGSGSYLQLGGVHDSLLIQPHRSALVSTPSIWLVLQPLCLILLSTFRRIHPSIRAPFEKLASQRLSNPAGVRVKHEGSTRPIFE